MYKYVESLEDEALSSKLFAKYYQILHPKFTKYGSIDKIADYIINYYQTIISSMPGNVYWFDKNCIAVGCNQNVLNMFGFKSIDEFKGLTFKEMGKIGHWSKHATESFEKDTLEVLKTGIAKLNIEEPVIPANGKMIYFLTSRVPLFDDAGDLIGVVGISIDITYRKEMEIQLKAAKEQAELANKSKSLFLANMSHDIKTPLSGMISSAEHLGHMIIDHEYKVRANDIVQSGLCLLDFINEVINHSSSEIKNLSNTQTRFKLKRLVDDIATLIKPAISNKSLQFDLLYDEKISLFLIGNNGYLYRILLNLLSNAIKFTDHGHITLEVKIVKKHAKSQLIKFVVKDTGIGIPKDKLQIIFDPFTRLFPSSDGVYQGSGLGLNIVKQFVKVMQGEIYVESELHVGSVFTVLIPFKKSLIQDEETMGKASSFLPINNLPSSQQLVVSTTKMTVEKPPIHVLFVEDNKIAAQSGKAILVSLGCKVNVVKSGQEAILSFQQNKYDLIYMDLGLPDMSGIEVTKKIRALEANSSEKVAILGLSAHVDKELRDVYCELGMDDVFPKPLLMELAKKNLLTYVPVTARLSHES